MREYSYNQPLPNLSNKPIFCLSRHICSMVSINRSFGLIYPCSMNLDIDRDSVNGFGSVLDGGELLHNQVNRQHLVLVAAGRPGAHAGQRAQRPARPLLDEPVGLGGDVGDAQRLWQPVIHEDDQAEEEGAGQCYH